MPKRRHVKIESHDRQHDRKSSPEIKGEESESGDAPNPEEIEEKDTLDLAHDTGLYEDQNEENPGELGLGEEIDKDEEYEKTH